MDNILREVLLNKDLMSEIQSHKKGTRDENLIDTVIIKWGSIRAFNEIVNKRLEFESNSDKYVTTSIKYNRHDILDIIIHTGTTEHFKTAMHCENISMIERYKKYASEYVYIINEEYDINVLHYILKENIIPEWKIHVCYRDGTGMYEISIQQLAYLNGDIDFLEWYSNKKEIPIDLAELIEYGDFDAFIYFYDDTKAINHDQATIKLQEFVNSIEKDEYFSEEQLSKLKNICDKYICLKC